MKDWRLTNQDLYLKGVTLKKVSFPEFWEKSYAQKNEFYALIRQDAVDFVNRYKRGESYLEGESVQEFWHAHCAFCTAKITTHSQCECYCTKDFSSWICKKCYKDFQPLFQWEVEL